MLERAPDAVIPLPSTTDVTLCRTLCVAAAAFCPPEDPGCLRRMRSWLRELFVVPGGVYAPQVEVIELVVNELASNAVTHTASGQGNFAVCALWDETTLRVTVSDQGSAQAKPAAAERWDYTAEAGRGLAMVGALCTWGYADTPQGTDVWALFHRDQTIGDEHRPPRLDHRTSDRDLRLHLIEGTR